MIDSGVKVSGYIRPIGKNDTYPTHLDILGKGGIHSNTDKEERNLIPNQRRSLGMFSYIESDSSMYGLFGGHTNDNWVKLLEYKDNRINFNIGCDKNYILVGNRNNIAYPSPILIDTKLDLINLRHDVNELLNTAFILEKANFKLPKAQALNILDDGFMYNTGGIISTTNDLPLPKLEHKHLWIGDSNNKPQAVTTIDIDNLPSLGVTEVPTPTGEFVGKVWEGTSDGRPKQSSIVGEMFADIEILNAKFLAGHFVMNSGLRASFPKAQFLNALTAGSLLKTSSTGDGKLESFILNQDQVLMGGTNNVPESRTRIGEGNLPLLAEGKLWKGGANSIAKSVTTIDRANLPNLTNNMVWQGNAEGRPTEVELNFAPVDASYIIKQPNAKLTNAQALSELTGGILKSAATTGIISIASGGKVPITNDYVRPIDLEEEIAEANTRAAAEAASAQAAAVTEATAAFTAYFTAQMLPYIPAGILPPQPVPVGTQISLAIAAASTGAASAGSAAGAAAAESAISHLKVNLTGEVKASGNIKDPIQTKVGFSFFNKTELPVDPHLGMLLFVKV